MIPVGELIYRALKGEKELNLLRARLTYAFAPWEVNKEQKETKEPDLEEYRGLFLEDEMVGNYILYPFEHRLGGKRISVGGIGGVASPPENRYKGYISEILKRGLAEMRQRGMSLSTLWPRSTLYPFYAKMGWAVGGETTRYEIDIDRLKFLDRPESGRFVPIDLDDYHSLMGVFEEWTRYHDFTMVRTDSWWQHRIIHRWGMTPVIYGWENNGELQGYMIFRFARTEKQVEIRVWEFAYKTPEAYRSLLHFAAVHSSQVGQVHLTGPADDPIFYMLEDAAPDRGLKVERRPGHMVRVVDVATAVKEIGLPGQSRPGAVSGSSPEGSFSLAVTDKQAPWNNGQFLVAVTGDGVSCSRVSDTPRDNADIALTIGQLSQLITGFRSLRDLADWNGVAVPSADAARLASQLWPKRSIFMTEPF